MKRIIVGSNPTGYGGGEGLWISKPGIAATSGNAADFLVAPGVNNAFGNLSATLAATSTMALISQSATSINHSINSFGDYVSTRLCVYGVYFPHSLGFVPMVWSDLDPSIVGNTTIGYYANPGGIAVNGDTANARTLYFCNFADATNVGVECHADMLWFASAGPTTGVIPTTITLIKNIRLAVLGVQVA